MSSFSIDMRQFIERAGARANQVVRKVVLDVSRGVITKSPVEFGRFKGNWQLGVDHAPTGELEHFDPSGSATLSRIEQTIPSDAAGKTYYLVNNLPYAQALEDGHSRQSPPGNMVAGTVAEFQRIVNEAAR